MENISTQVHLAHLHESAYLLHVQHFTSYLFDKIYLTSVGFCVYNANHRLMFSLREWKKKWLSVKLHRWDVFRSSRFSFTLTKFWLVQNYYLGIVLSFIKVLLLLGCTVWSFFILIARYRRLIYMKNRFVYISQR